MIQKTLTILFYCLIYYTSATAQDIIISRYYPDDTFRYPLDLPPSTAGSFGEMRPNHFHSGLDFKTNQRVGYPLFSVYDGYVSRVRIQYGGFGRAIYITHPNGYTSVYGHLESFTPEVERLVRQYQYEKQTYEADFYPLDFQIPVRKGQKIGVAGNAGASAGPHLHFEIRDSKTEETINPQLFGLTIPDKVPPTILAAGIYHLNGAPFSEKTKRQFLNVTGAGSTYRLAGAQTLQLSGEVGFALTTHDMNSVSPNRNGIYQVELKLDGKTIYTYAIERFAFNQTRAINAYIDYPAYLSSRRWMQKCFVPPGSNAGIYPQSINNGIINFNDDALHEVEYVVKDVAGNTSNLVIKVQSKATVPAPFKPEGILFKYNNVNIFTNDKIKVTIDTGNLYDDLDFKYVRLPRKPGALSETHRIHNKFTPLHEGFNLWIKPDSTIGRYANKAVLVNTAGNVAPGIYEDGYVKGKCRFFGDYYLRVDTVAPVITPINITDGANLKAAKTISLKMSDNLSGIKKYSGKIDGRWVLVEHDYKSKQLRYYFDADISAGKHTFELTVTDNEDNVAHYTADFYR
ncbi:M23 family peptidase [Mucilaginibacter hurinus]|uniref:M23 family peptidase n=1 Tax=Mucilaginibacter hurinus TaxID=2201324 RepID=A0A367GT09_9SPHI|nr:M23 family metallopeptidase [Mucilaginibacter hurinus]RCH56547.1 M23 family peptidase [Mucilaginibacter hurinus]